MTLTGAASVQWWREKSECPRLRGNDRRSGVSTVTFRPVAMAQELERDVVSHLEPKLQPWVIQTQKQLHMIPED